MSCDCEQTECWECYPHYDDHIPLEFDSVRELIIGYEKLEKENQQLKSQLALCVEALDYIRKISYNEGFKIYRNDKDLVKTTLDKLAAMQSEGEK